MPKGIGLYPEQTLAPGQALEEGLSPNSLHGLSPEWCHTEVPGLTGREFSKCRGWDIVLGGQLGGLPL